MSDWFPGSAEEMKPLLRIFARMAVTGEWTDLCLQAGFLPVPVHFHSPIPDLADLEHRRVWTKRSELPGIDFRPEAQTRLLAELGKAFGAECLWPVHPTEDPAQFYTPNTSFTYGCAASTYCIIRRFQPNLVVEIGSGNSSRVIAQAVRQNREQHGQQSRYVVIDPYPGAWVDDPHAFPGTLIRSRVETGDSDFFDQLQANDILFIDSGHSVRIGSDVNYLFLDVLPRLAPGVIVHIHDIALPFEYQEVYARNPSFRQFWTEQYLLQSFLCFNDQFEVLLGMNYLSVDHMDLLRAAFPHYDPEIHKSHSGSFWIRRTLAGSDRSS